MVQIRQLDAAQQEEEDGGDQDKATQAKPAVEKSSEPTPEVKEGKGREGTRGEKRRAVGKEEEMEEENNRRRE